MEEENKPLWPWILGFLAFSSYRNRKNSINNFNEFYSDNENFFEEE